MSERPNNVTSMAEFKRSREQEPVLDIASIRRRLAEISIDKALLDSEEQVLLERLRNSPTDAS